MYPSELIPEVDETTQSTHALCKCAFLTTYLAMLNGQMLFDRQMHVKMVGHVYLSL